MSSSVAAPKGKTLAKGKGTFAKGKTNPLAKAAGKPRKPQDTKDIWVFKTQEREDPDAKKPAEPAEILSRQERKEITRQRRLARANGELIQQLKKKWEQIRMKHLSAEERRPLLAEAMGLIRDDCVSLVLKHDASRIVQTCVKYGSRAERDEICSLLKGNFVLLAASPYASKLIDRLLALAPSSRPVIIGELTGHVTKMLTRERPAAIVDTIYSLYARVADKNQMRCEFYGREFALFKSDTPKSLADILAEVPQKREAILKSLRTNITRILNKNTCRFEIVHDAAHSLLFELEPAQRLEFMEELQDQIPNFVHTPKGAEICMEIIAAATAAKRKAIIRSFKDFVYGIAENRYGWMVLVRLLESVDDTKLLNTGILNELLKDPKNVLCHSYARRPILGLLRKRPARYFDTRVIKLLEQTDVTSAVTSKKDFDRRQGELRAMVSPVLVSFAAENASILLRSTFGSEVFAEIILHADNPGPVVEQLVALIRAQPVAPAADASPIELQQHLMSSPLVTRTLKRIINEEATAEGEAHLSAPLLDAVKDRMVEYADTVGSFVVLALLESPVTAEAAHAALKPHLAAVEALESKGAPLIASRLKQGPSKLTERVGQETTEAAAEGTARSQLLKRRKRDLLSIPDSTIGELKYRALLKGDADAAEAATALLKQTAKDATTPADAEAAEEEDAEDVEMASGDDDDDDSDDDDGDDDDDDGNDDDDDDEEDADSDENDDEEDEDLPTAEDTTPRKKIRLPRPSTPRSSIRRAK
ncbi:hypothetical protein, variant [Fonticula alba]|uniref:CPL domain-containing protein n=1 Tax=Fonticula alba TaxID=691883 RepID=A0A058ZHM8_FONAL|nr:hypothetical protein, variant [Fonticula alba]KCV72977.1 hypothetical protein, variant [Fonticula alba]|eukprot:XP_009492678.1 hypothetical protein, variant [Fonticula alba]